MRFILRTIFLEFLFTTYQNTRYEICRINNFYNYTLGTLYIPNTIPLSDDKGASWKCCVCHNPYEENFSKKNRLCYKKTLAEIWQNIEAMMSIKLVCIVDAPPNTWICNSLLYGSLPSLNLCGQSSTIKEGKCEK